MSQQQPILERRNVTRPVQLREAGAPVTIDGYGAVYYSADDPGTQYQLWQDTYERISPGAFDLTVREDDIRSLFNHDANIVLGRNRSDPATLAVAVDQVGLRYSVTPPDTQLVRDQVLTPIRRGDVAGASIAFYARKVAWVIEKLADGWQIEIRELQQIQLVEVGPVTFPAYEATSAGVSRAGDPQNLMALRVERLRFLRGDDWECTDVAVRLRMAEIARARL